MLGLPNVEKGSGHARLLLTTVEEYGDEDYMMTIIDIQ